MEGELVEENVGLKLVDGCRSRKNPLLVELYRGIELVVRHGTHHQIVTVKRGAPAVPDDGETGEEE